MTTRIAVPNKGRLQEPTLRLLREAGLNFETGERALTANAVNADVELLFVRAEDIPELVADGVATLGVTGLDLVAEHGDGLDVILELGYGRCRLAAAAPKDSPYRSLEDLAGARVATSHANTVRRFFSGRDIPIDLIPLRGSVEVSPRLGVADAIVDLVSTGSTLLANGLRELGTILSSQAVLVADPRRANGEVSRMATAFGAVVTARSKRYLLLNAPAGSIEAISALIPGLEAPTVVPLAEEDWVAIHSVVDASDVWHLLPKLKEAGGQGILVLPIDQVIA